MREFSPAVTVLMPNFNCERYVASAIRSVLNQTLDRIELVVVDDCSTDGSLGIINDLAGQDSRVRVFSTGRNGGPGVARNIGLEAARGDYVAVVDSDDLVHPERLARMVAAAEASGAEMVCDNLLVFDDDRRTRPFAFLDDTEPRDISAAEFVHANVYGATDRPLGYLKPLFNAAFIRAGAYRYRAELKIAQDFDFVLRQMVGGARKHLIPSLTYYYRKHAKSNSHRLKGAHVEAMIAADADVAAGICGIAPDLAAAFAARRSAFERELAFDRLLTALKGRNAPDAVRTMLRRPEVVPLLGRVVRGRLKRLRRPPAMRQGVLFATGPGGPSAALRSFAAELRREGIPATLVLLAQAEAGDTSAFSAVVPGHGKPEPVLADLGRTCGQALVADSPDALAALSAALRPDSPTLLFAGGSGWSDRELALARTAGCLVSDAADQVASVRDTLPGLPAKTPAQALALVKTQLAHATSAPNALAPAHSLKASAIS